MKKKLSILIYVNTNVNFSNKNLGGIETLSLELYKFFCLQNFDVSLTNKLNLFHLRNKWDYLISSNDAKIFNNIDSRYKVLWLHNKLQIEKALRKNQILPIIQNKILAVFNSNYLLKNTSSLFFFKKKIVIPNFLSTEFTNIKINYKRKPYFVWSVQRTKGLSAFIDVWINQIRPNHKSLKLFIFGVPVSEFKKLGFKKLYKYNIFFKGRVKKIQLIKYYKQSMGMICLGYDETFCLNAIESFACGLPIITFGLTAVSELINSKNSIKINNYNDLNKSIISIYRFNYRKRKTMINSCVKFSKKYKINKVGNNWLKILENSQINNV